MAITQQPDNHSEIGIASEESFDLASAIETIVREPLELLARLLDGIDNVALVDYPEYANVGDSLIWLGQVALFKRLRKKIVYVDAAWNAGFDALHRVVAQGAAVIITGGGNFGTLWPEHQNFRESLLQRMPAATIIQMPQSIYFDDGLALQRFQRIAAKCPHFHFLARDIPSFEFAKTHFSSSVDLCPDSAFFLGEIDAAHTAVDVLYLRRSDKESDSLADCASDVASHVALKTCSHLVVEQTDWLQQNILERALQKLTRGLIRLRLLRNTSALMLHLYSLLARARARRGIRIIARGKCVITDRLHAHILSVLMGRHNLLLDNSNGKVFAFYEAWTRGWPFTLQVKTVEEAFKRASAILRRNPAMKIVGVLPLLPALRRIADEINISCSECSQIIVALSSGWMS